ncbi:MAG: hypothetical protein O3B13_05345 [Planctomycetota bacterium]|nr:hypothetical protein [Planctomycetota bacterium]
MTTTALLAAPGAGDFLPIIFVVIAIISGLVNFIKERRAGEQVNAGMRGDANIDQGLQSEIDSFLQELSPGDSNASRSPRQSGTQPQRRRKRASSPEEVERKRRVRARREHDRLEDEVAKNRMSLSKRHLETNDLSEVSHRHVRSAVGGRHLEPQIHDLMEQSPKPTPTPNISPETSFVTGSVHALLRQPGSIRNAVLLTEILGPPIARRRRGNV